MRYAKIVLLLLGTLAFANAGSPDGGFNDPPYYLFPYAADTTDRPPLNYTKVCPVGKTEEGTPNMSSLASGIRGCTKLLVPIMWATW